jgi:hypothetical protein
LKVGRRRTKRDWWLGLRWPDGRVLGWRREAEREREKTARGEREKEGFRKWKPYPIKMPINGNFPKMPLQLSLTITPSYEL